MSGASTSAKDASKSSNDKDAAATPDATKDAAAPPAKVEEDDEFEDFPAEGWWWSLFVAGWIEWLIFARLGGGKHGPAER
jgi:hypothetical protein